MSSYRFYYLNNCDHIVDADWLPCTGDDVAIARAQALLGKVPDCRAIEIWQGTRRVNTVGCAIA